MFIYICTELLFLSSYYYKHELFISITRKIYCLHQIKLHIFFTRLDRKCSLILFQSQYLKRRQGLLPEKCPRKAGHRRGECFRKKQVSCCDWTFLENYVGLAMFERQQETTKINIHVLSSAPTRLHTEQGKCKDCVLWFTQKYFL